MSLASETREAVREHPFLLAGLSAGVVNFTAAARFLDVGETEAVAAALRRFAEEFPPYESIDRSVRITMQSGLGRTNERGDALLAIGDERFAADAGTDTAVVAVGEVDAVVAAEALARLGASGVHLQAAGVTGDSLVVIVERQAGPNALRIVESTFAAGPPRVELDGSL